MIHYSNENIACPDCHCVSTKKLSIEELDQLPDFECCCSCHDNEESLCGDET